MIQAICEQCHAPFSTWPSVKKKGNGKFCSYACSGIARRLIPQETFWRRVQKTETCWWWTGSKDYNGYGIFRVGDRLRYFAHRFSYELNAGSIPEGMRVCHRCDQPLCVNPEHLFLGTPADNSADMVAKGRQNNDKKGLAGETNPAAKLTVDQVIAIRTSTEIARIWAMRLNVTLTAIHDIRQRRSWRHIP